jgi:hypothetical protein
MRNVNIRAYSSDDPGIPTDAYVSMKHQWDLIDDIMAGLDTMRQRGEVWLPREPNEQIGSYKNRLKRTFLYPAFKDTVEKLTSKPFSQQITVQEDGLDPRILDMIHDMDGEGTDLTQHARDAYELMVTYGKVHVYTDFANTGGTQNALEEKSLTPVAHIVMPHDLIGWRYEVVNGKTRLTQIRFRKYESEDIGRWGNTEREYLMVINAPGVAGSLGTWERWKLEDSGKYSFVESGTHTYPGIPLDTAYAKRRGFMIAKPPMRDLAELNLQHWQSSSDQRNALRFARIGMFAATGISQEEYEKEQTIAPTNMFKSTNPEAKYYFVENNGAAIKAGAEEITHIEEQMEVMGAAPFIARTARSTAAGKAIDRSEANTDAQAWVRICELLYKSVFNTAATWMKIKLPEKFGVQIFDEFDAPTDTSDNPFLLQARTAGELSRETFLGEIKRRGTLAESVDVQEEIDRISTEGPTFQQQMDQQRMNAVMGGDPNADPAATPPDKKPPFPPKK